MDGPRRKKKRLMRAALLLGLAGAIGLLLPASGASGEDSSSTPTYTAQDYRDGGDRCKVLVSSRARALIARLRKEGAKHVQGYSQSTLLDLPRAALRRLKSDEFSQLSVREDFDQILLKTGPLNTRRMPWEKLGEDESPRGAKKGKELRLIHCAGPLQEAWLEQLDSLPDVHRITYLPQNAYLLWVSRQGIREIRRRCSFVQWDGPFQASYKIHPRLGRMTGSDVVVRVLLVDHPEVEQSLNDVKRSAKSVVQPEHRRLGQVTVSVNLPGSEVEQVAQLPDVIGIEPYVKPQLFDEVQDQILAGNLTANGNSPTGPGYLAALAALGFPTDPALYPVVDVTDDGFDNGSAVSPGHPDFYQLGGMSNPSRVLYAVDRTADGKPHGIAGHGTINASIVGGYNNGTGFPFEDGSGFQFGLGMAPFGRLASSKIFNDSGAFGLIGSFTDLVSGSYGLGARIATNSWGANTAGDYGAEDQEYDALVRDAQPTVSGNQGMSILFAAGNAGPGSQTAGSPGNAKNVITVGAAENVRPTGTDGCGISNAGADLAQDMASFSSRGPTSDGRVKPDLVAPGTHIQGAASQDPLFNGSSVCGDVVSHYFPPGQTLYTWSSGTSHSTPAAAGAAALLYQRFQGETGSPPSPAMLKAMLINATRYLSGAGAGGNLPSLSQGWGEIHLSGFLTAARVAKDQAQIFSGSGGSSTTSGLIQNSTKPLKVVLAWTEPPGPTVGASFVNDLDLEVIAGGRLYRGNRFLGAFSTEGGTADTTNNVEAVFLPAGTAGNVAVRVKSTTIAGDGVPGNADPSDQDFALSIQNLTESAVPVLRAVSTTVDDAAGNGSGFLDPGETAGLFIEVANDGLAQATGGSSTLASSNPNVTILQANSLYPTLAPNSAGANQTSFQVSVGAGAACGSLLDFNLTLQTNQGVQVLPVSVRLGGAVPSTLLSANFESGAAGFTAAGLWHLETGCRAVLGGHSPVTTFYYGRTGFCNYDSAVTSGTLASPEIDLTNVLPPITLTFNHLLGREPGVLGSFDIAQVELSENAGPFSTLAGPFDSTGGLFVPVTLDVSSHSGSKIRLRWFFNTVDGLFNNFEGWHVDDVRVDGNVVVCQPIGPGNRPPVLNPIGNKSVNENQLLQFSVSGSDPDGDPVSFSASNLPLGASFSNGTFSWTPTFTQAGTYPNVHFEASDGSLTDTEDITITVNNVPRPSSISGTVTNSVGQPLSAATMTLVKHSPTSIFTRTTQTNSSGQYQFPNLAADLYDLTASKSGFKNLRKRVSLGSEEDKTVNFVLQPK